MNLPLPAILVLLTLLGCSQGYRILALFSHNGKSHFDVFRVPLIALAERGHEVTVVSHFPEKQPPKGYKDIDVNVNNSILLDWMDLQDLVGRSRIIRYLEPWILAYVGDDACKRVFSSQKVLDLIKSKQRFDVIITEYFNTNCLIPFAYKFDAPLIALSSSGLMPWNSYAFGNPDNPSYITDILIGYSDDMSFLERVENTVAGIIHRWAYYILVEIPGDKFARQFFGKDMPPVRDILYNYTSLMLVNTHFTYNLPKPYVPSIIEVGGLHIGKPKKLPKNIEKWINESTHGVIYFSLGSMIKGHTFPEEKRQAFLRAFGRLPQRVLWKWENDTMPGQPDNVMIQKWMPQLDILCHPNVKAFISHGGLLGTTEAVHCGVPVVVMPQFGDQHTNAKALEKNGGGVILHLHEADEEKVYNALKKVLDPSFNKQAKELSERFRDRPMPPLETAIYWVEYVARHKGAPHMRTAAVGMPLYKYLLLDVIAFLIAVFTVLSWLAYYITKKAIKLVFRSKEKVKTS